MISSGINNRKTWIICIVAICVTSAVWGILGTLYYGRWASVSQAGVKGSAPEATVVVGGERIFREELDGPVAARIFDLERQIYSLRKKRLEQVIVQHILPKEADRRGIPEGKLIEEILAGGIEVTPDEIEEYASDNARAVSGWKGSQDELRQRISDQLGRLKGYQKVLDYAKSLGNKYGLRVNLQEPNPPKVNLTPGKDPALGSSAAPITIMEYSDYQCSACRKAHKTVKRLRELYPDSVRWVIKDFPMSLSSRYAAEAVRCADEQGKADEYHDLLFSQSNELTSGQLTAYASRLGLEMTGFNSCLESRKYRDAVESNIKEAAMAGIGMTPTFVINGKMIPGAPPLEDFKKLISKELSGNDFSS